MGLTSCCQDHVTDVHYSEVLAAGFSCSCSPETTHLPVQNPPSITNVNQLPIEMLREIFMKTIEVDPSSSVCVTNGPGSDGTLSASPPYAVVLSQVCTLWRQVALSTSTLWTTIRVVPSSKHLVSQLHWTKLFLAHANSHPLNLVLKDCKSRSGSATSSGCQEICATRSILALFISKAQYWRTIDFHISLEALDLLLAMTASPKRYNCAQLRSASLLVSKSTCGKLPADHLSSPVGFINGTWAMAFLATTWKFLLASPGMSEITWWPGFHRIFLVPPVDMFDQLERLNVHYDISAEELLRILAYFPQIKKVVVTNFRLPSITIKADSARSPRLLLDSLEVLYLKSSVKVTPLFDGLIAPSLRLLELHCLDSMKSCSEDGLALKRFLRDSQCRLQKLVLDNC
ncbi:hypothetical protein CPB84DRAFT_1828758 [Gymnopilus junonius]|uniref:F-box domain-containing protein n=1 Tax=Gymnopilus junonius TaxID=109634 RepID=A0A9P5NA50_GYMJU|nr:hypothetical protein CPB84DRAFT_1828758 [Gymnopilus junonius]